MSTSNYSDVVAQLESKGLELTRPLELDGRIQRWSVAGEGREKRGWTRLREWTSKARNTYIVGVYGVWHGTDDGLTKIDFPDKTRQSLTDDDWAAIKEAQKTAARKLAEERKEEAKKAAAWAALVWSKCSPCAAHEYLARKQIQPHHVRVLDSVSEIELTAFDDANHYRLNQSVGALVIPMHDTNGNVCGLQLIFPKGHPRAVKTERDKEFWPSGMAMGGTFGLIGAVRRSGILLLCEGYATAASLAEATGQAVAYAFSANNLVKAGKQLRKAYPQLRLLICADDDYLTEGNPGLTHAAQASAEIEKSAWTRPDFSGQDGADLRGGKKLTDYNDLAVLSGTPLVLANQINGKLEVLGWRDADLVAGRTNSGGGDDGANRRSAVSILSLDECVERFIYIDDATGSFVFDTWTKSVCDRSKLTNLLPAGVRTDDIKRHPRWIERAVYIDQIGFDPAGDDANVLCNRWNGWPTVPVKGECRLLLDLLEFLCAGEANRKELLDWILKWLAYPIQHPGAKMQSAIVIHGPQGTGKSRFFEAYAKIFGDYGLVLNQGAIEDKFNADWSERKLFILADEIVARADMYHLKNQLKNFITGEWVRVNPKNVAAHRERNHMNIVFSSNEKQPVILENDDRRHCVIWTPQKRDEEYYEEVSAEIDAGGVAALHDYLMNLDLGTFKPWTKPPMTEAKRELIDISRDSADRFLQEWRDGDIELPFCPCGSSDLYRAYLDWCRRNGERMPRPDNQFTGNVLKLPGWVKDRYDIYLTMHYVRPSKRQRMIVPSGQALEDAAKAGLTDYRRKPGQNQTEWLTDCFLAFHNALEGIE